MTHEGAPASGAFSSVLASEATVTSVQAGATRETMRLVVQTDKNEQIYVVFDMVSGAVKSATQMLTSTVTFGPSISLLKENSALLVPTKTINYATRHSYRFFYTSFDDEEGEKEHSTFLKTCDW